MNIKLSDLTLVGWLLALATIGIVVLLAIYSGTLWTEIMPGMRGPEVLLAAPSILIGILFFGIGTFVLRAAGFPIVKRAPPPAGDAPPKKDGTP
jgi:hypothetical protein